MEIKEVPIRRVIGIDVGVKELLTTSDGIIIKNMKFIEKYEKKLKGLNRWLARCQKGSKNREKVKCKIQEVYSELKNARKYFLHKTSKQLVEQILTDADFEIISNKLIQIRTSQHSDSLSLIGVDAYINNDVDISSYSSQLEKEKFHLLVTHCPDFIQQGTIEISNFDVILSGHSLGGQIYIPVLGGMVHQEGATKYYHGAYQINQTKLYICNGLGTINIDMRLFAPPEIIILKLKQI
jgi:predicted MPP superfamily phosphohydrolase